VTAYRITGKRAIKSRFAAKTMGKLTQLVGRQHELQQISTLWERTKEGKGQVALLCGEAGIGKSRVCEEWLDSISDEPHITIRNQCSAHHTNSPFYPVIKQLEHAARFERENTPDAKLSKLEGLLSQAGTAALADVPFIAALLSLPADEFCSLRDLTPRRQRDLTIAALLRQILGLALTRPVVVELSDAHWVDSSTLELFTRCIAEIKKARVFILVSFRPEFFPQWLDQSHVTMLRLNRLSHEQTEAIVLDVARHKELPPELHEQIIRKADGVPLFAEELTKSLLEAGRLQNTGERYVSVGPPLPLGIPTTLLGSLTARLDRLGPIKEIAQIGATIGREFSYRLLTAVAPGGGGPPLNTALAHLSARELIFERGEPPDSTYIFKHALVQDAAYATITRSKRELLHSRIADALVAGFPEMVETRPELIAHHFAQAGLPERAIEYLRKAGRRAIERSANAEAIRHLTAALEALKSLPETPERNRAALELELMLAQAMIVDRGYAAPETKEVLLRAKALIDDSTEPSQNLALLYGMWACHYVGGEIEQRDAAVELLAEAERRNDAAALCIAHRVLGTTYVTMGDFAAGLQHLDGARTLYDAEHHSSYRYQYGQDIGAAALCYLSWALWHLGKVDQASEVAAEAMNCAEELSHPHTLVYTICHARGFMDLFRRRCEDTQSYAALVVSLCAENGFSHWINCGRVLEGWAEICRGNVDQGIELVQAGVIGWQKRGARLWLPIFLTLEAEACAKAGRTDAALQAIEAAHTISKETGECWAMAEVLRVKARLLLATGRAQADEIESLLVNSLEIARQQRALCWELRASCDLARLWQSQGRNSKALKLLQSVYDQFMEGFDTADLRDAKAIIESLRHKPGRKQSQCAGKVRLVS